MVEGIIEVQDLTKYYGNFPAVMNVSFTVHQGEIVGLLGPNGAGKTTIMRIMTGFLPPSSGMVRLAGHNIVTDSLAARRLLGYLPETVPLYTDMTVRDYLTFMGTIRGMDRKRLRQRIDEVVELIRFTEYIDSHISKLSKGYRQRVGIAQAILHEPQFLILDEPTIGIDPIQVVETRSLIKQLAQDHTVILSSHILPEVSQICERVVIIHEGRVVAEDKPQNLSQRLKKAERFQITIRGPADRVLRLLRSINGVTDVTFQGTGDTRAYTVQARPGVDLEERLSSAVVNNGFGLLHMEHQAMSLEEVFLQLTTTEEEVGA